MCLKLVMFCGLGENPFQNTPMLVVKEVITAKKQTLLCLVSSRFNEGSDSDKCLFFVLAMMH